MLKRNNELGDGLEGGNEPVDLTLLVCLYYEQECVHEFVKQVKAQLDTAKRDGASLDWEIMFIDDGSRDKTVELVSAMADEDPRIRLLALNRNYGKEAAITAGIRYASGDVIVMMDPDLQDPPERILDFYDEVRNGNDLVWGIREQQSRTLASKLFSKVFWKVLRGMTGLDIPVDVAVMRGFSHRFADAFLQFPESNRFIEGIFASVGYQSTQLTIENRPRFAGESKFTYGKRIKLAIKAITAFSERPLQLGVLTGLAGLFGSVGYGLFLIIRKLFFDIGMLGWTSTITVVVFMGCINLIVLGLTGLYVGRIYREVKQRPIFLIDRAWNINANISPRQQVQLNELV